MKISATEIRGTGFQYPIELHEDFSGISASVQSVHEKQSISKIAIFTNREIAGIYEKYLTKEILDLNLPFRFFYLKAGEKNKHIDRTKKIYNQLIEWGTDRKALILAFGGGVVGDFTGFIAATYQRGVRFAQIPTTLLASVDSSVGGKVAVNVDSGKNMVGAFYQPEFVYAPLLTLSTLPYREWSCGLAEVLKHAFLEGGEFLQNIQTWTRADMKPTSKEISYLIQESIRVKAKVVSSDEKELGLRAILNLGHTTGHAIESVTRYKKYSHGEAIAIGLVTSLLLSRELLQFPSDHVKSAIQLMKQFGLPTDLKEKPQEILQHMEHDKKKEGSTIRFVLLEDFGKPRFGIPVERSLILKILHKHQAGIYG